MNSLARRMALRQLAKRAGGHSSDAALRQRILDGCFDKQRDFILDPSREKTALCPRRAGKTTLVPNYSILKLLESPGGRIIRYWGVTQDRAYQLMWRPMQRAHEKYGVRFKANEDMMTFYWANGSEIRLVGADKLKDAEKQRGEATVLDIVDECSLYGPILEAIAEEIIGPSLMDYLGTVCYMGTPGIVFDGYWFRLTGPAPEDGPPEKQKVPGISRHCWDVYDNPFMPHAREEIEAERVRRRWPLDHPSFLRERRGRWVNDTEGLFYKYNPEQNSYDGTLPGLPAGQGWSYTLGWDIGADDAMALVVWAYTETDPHLYEVYSWKKSHALISAVAAKVKKLEGEFGTIPLKVADTGGGGKVAVQEMSAREHIHFEAAKKTDKPGIARFMNDDFVGGFIKVRTGSPLAQEYIALTKDPDNPEEEDENCENHCADAGLYSYRRARHYRYEKREEEPAVGTKAHFDKIAADMRRRERERIQRAQATQWWEE